MAVRRTRSGVLGLLLALALVVAGLAPAGAATGRDVFRPGAAGIGDDYFPLAGNGGYDVRHYLLDVDYDPATDHLAGVATIRAVATQNLSRFNLDFVGLTLRSLTVNGRPATWTRTDHELVVTPKAGLRKGKPFVVVARYDGVPITQELVLGPDLSIEAGFMHTDDGAVIAGQPDVAATWYPVNDHPLDKAAYTFVVTVPAGLEVMANGHLVGHTTRGDQSTWVWDAREPMASYLSTATMGQFDIHKYRLPNGLPMIDALDPDLFDQPSGGAGSPSFGDIAAGSLARQDDILGFLSDTFGRYPFSTSGGIVDDYDNLFFALETQTRPVYSKFFFRTPQRGDSVVVHELAHQWFGDSVALAGWQHIWLNEGFASYAEWLWSENQGLGTAQEIFDATYAGIPADDPFWSVVIGDPGVERLFDDAVYDRGAMTLHALRREVGDADFFRILRAWAAKKGGGNGTTPEFIALAERISGQQLDKLFDTWLFTGSKPVLDRTSVSASSEAATIGPRVSDVAGAVRLRR
jgi:aminopeptidase N